ncbi:MAG: hypothetical protein LPK21_03185 [Hymenobacteraceae bacterium]|nr:hypothetical protein [Hymenobacteraceae bacterium]MDX5511219.1 hypothetical protein [Hymenobacteraceae bacterium]
MSTITRRCCVLSPTTMLPSAFYKANVSLSGIPVKRMKSIFNQISEKGPKNGEIAFIEIAWGNKGKAFIFFKR